jgi:hypothetical protein
MLINKICKNMSKKKILKFALLIFIINFFNAKAASAIMLSGYVETYPNRFFPVIVGIKAQQQATEPNGVTFSVDNFGNTQFAASFPLNNMMIFQKWFFKDPNSQFFLGTNLQGSFSPASFMLARQPQNNGQIIEGGHVNQQINLNPQDLPLNLHWLQFAGLRYHSAILSPTLNPIIPQVWRRINEAGLAESRIAQSLQNFLSTNPHLQYMYLNIYNLETLRPLGAPHLSLQFGVYSADPRYVPKSFYATNANLNNVQATVGVNLPIFKKNTNTLVKTGGRNDLGIENLNSTVRKFAVAVHQANVQLSQLNTKVDNLNLMINQLEAAAHKENYALHHKFDKIHTSLLKLNYESVPTQKLSSFNSKDPLHGLNMGICLIGLFVTVGLGYILQKFRKK